MLLKLCNFFVIICVWQINGSFAHYQSCNNAANLEVCVGNKNVEVKIFGDDLICQVSETPKSKVRDDYTHAPGQGYYKLHTIAKNWNDARKVCLEEGAHLAIIESKEEEQAILDIYKKQKSNINKAARTDIVWLGSHNLFAKQDWVTVNGDSLPSTGYVNWSKGCDGYPAEPNNDGGDEHCLTIYDGKCQGWNDYKCPYNLGFVCEIPDVCA